MATLLKRILISFFTFSVSTTTFAQCDCPTPRPIHATATSGVVTLEYEEEFVAKKQMPDRIEIVLQPDRHIGSTGIVGHIDEIVRRLETEARRNFQHMGITSEITVSILQDDSRNLSGDGFRFLKSGSGPDQNGETLTMNAYARPVYESTLPPEPGVFKTQVQIRAKVCVEKDDTHLTFQPDHRRRMAPVLPDDANIPDHILEQKKSEFATKVQQEIDRIKDALTATNKQLTEQQRMTIRDASVEMFEVNLPITFFGREYEFPVRVTPLKQVRICSNTIGG